MTSDTARIKATLAQERQFHPVVAVVGVGYVGSHLVEAFARVYEVIAFDVSKQRIEKIAQQFSGSAAVRTTSHAPDLAAANAILISVPTPLNHDKTIDTTFLEIAIRTIAQHVRPGVTVVVESTVAIGMTRELLSFLVATKHAKVGMSPERVDPGRKFPAFQSIPKIISGIDSPSLAAVHQLYGRVFDHLIPVSSLEAAEMTKLYENCQRMVCAAYANEMADACASLGIDEWEVSRAAASKPFGYQPFWPGPGVGGPCIPVNPYYLLKTCNMPILQHATETSWRRPSEIVDRLMRVLENKRGTTGARRPLSNLKMRVLVVGVGFKRGQSMLHNSPGVAAIQFLLGKYDLDVEFADPLVDQTALAYVPKLNTSVDWNKNSLEEFAGILVTVDQVGLDMHLLDLLEGVIVHNYSPRSYTLASL
ncbi:nucleotide sugar dehydrogenase [Sphaerulina musiva SO2202]|uniref:Nucleotide sugar dehydrogenase n=1 Tax=Sphaerulina musiva (strain SO2202) TaxID=692275 RepID=M3DDK2_SPHMS|nr:nucleotide sugar dehydrogenase [Sphaerulina musiva SO2202]EMF15894.1 nucleotide sugar dehydrogenase [Sphaerulina musiva SO2202]